MPIGTKYNNLIVKSHKEIQNPTEYALFINCTSDKPLFENADNYRLPV